MKPLNFYSKKNYLFPMILVSVISLSINTLYGANNITYTYDFSNDIARASTPCTPPAYNISIGRDNSATAGVVSYLDSNGITSNVLRTFSQGQRNSTGVIDLNVFPKKATDYSVTWKTCVNSPTGDYKTGVILRGDTANRGTSSTGYVQGMMQGYLLLPYNNGANGSQFRIYKSTSSGLSMLINTAVSSLILSKATPVWYRASVSGTTSVALKIEYSTDSINWNTGASYTDTEGSYQSGATQYIWGLAITSTDFFVDNITFSGNADDDFDIPENPVVPVPGDKLSENDLYRLNMTVDGTSRTMLVYAPLELPENRPLLVSFSGMNMNDAAQADGARYWMVADTAKFLVVYPNPVDAAASWDMTGNSDLDFFSAIIDKMYELYKIDKKRVYISGFSWGSNFCYRVANNLADKVAAMGPVMGHSYGTNPNVATSSHPMPIIQFTGIYDDVFKMEYVQPVLDVWIAWDGCSTTSTFTSPYPVGSTTSTVTKTLWKNEETGVEIMWLKTPNGHSIPLNPLQVMSNLEVWNFCKKYSLDDFTSSDTPVVKGVTATIISEEYFNITGQKINTGKKQNIKGFYIVKSYMSDGTIRSKTRINL